MREQLMPLIVSVVAVALQILVAPIIPIFGVYPNFIIPLALVLSVVRNPDSTYAYAFGLGLVSDLLADTPLGLTPLLLLVAAFALSRAFEVMDKTTFVMPLIAIAVALLLFELVVAIVLSFMGYGGFFDLLVSRALPATVIEAVVGVIAYLVAGKLSLGQTSNSAWTVSSADRYR